MCCVVSCGQQDLDGLLAAFDEERKVMGERHAAAEQRATQLQAQVRWTNTTPNGRLTCVSKTAALSAP